MIFVRQLQNYIQTNKGQKNTIIPDFSINVYDNGMEAAISHNGRVILKISVHSSKLKFNMPDNNNLNIIDYTNSQTVALSGQNTLLDLYNGFASKDDIQDVLAVLLMIH